MTFMSLIFLKITNLPLISNKKLLNKKKKNNNNNPHVGGSLGHKVTQMWVTRPRRGSSHDPRLGPLVTHHGSLDPQWVHNQTRDRGSWSWPYVWVDFVGPRTWVTTKTHRGSGRRDLAMGHQTHKGHDRTLSWV
jgi:hypothetical protein